MNERCSFWGEKDNADKRRVISLIQCPRLLMHNKGGLGFERARAFFSLLELPVMLMISSAGITWSISDVVEGLVITGTAEDYQAVSHYCQTGCEFATLHITHADNMKRGGDAKKQITRSAGVTRYFWNICLSWWPLQVVLMWISCEHGGSFCSWAQPVALGSFFPPLN